MLQTCAGEALTTMLALMVRLFNPVTAIATSEAPPLDDEGCELWKSLATCISTELRTAGGDGSRCLLHAGSMASAFRRKNIAHGRLGLRATIQGSFRFAASATSPPLLD